MSGFEGPNPLQSRYERFPGANTGLRFSNECNPPQNIWVPNFQSIRPAQVADSVLSYTPMQITSWPHSSKCILPKSATHISLYSPTLSDARLDQPLSSSYYFTSHPTDNVVLFYSPLPSTPLPVTLWLAPRPTYNQSHHPNIRLAISDTHPRIMLKTSNMLTVTLTQAGRTSHKTTTLLYPHETNCMWIYSRTHLSYRCPILLHPSCPPSDLITSMPHSCNDSITISTSALTIHTKTFPGHCLNVNVHNTSLQHTTSVVVTPDCPFLNSTSLSLRQAHRGQKINNKRMAFPFALHEAQSILTPAPGISFLNKIAQLPQEWI